MRMGKTVWTASYGKALKIPRSVVLIATSRSVPEWFRDCGVPYRHELELAPSRQVLDESKRDPEYDWRTAYQKQLAAMDLRHAYGCLPDECALLCYEKDWNDCHRKILFEALHTVFGCAGGEWDGGGAKFLEQLSLF